MKKTINKYFGAIGAASFVLVAVSAQAVPTGTLTLSDGNGHSATVSDGGTGVGSFNGTLGSWNINVSTGTVSPPLPGLGTLSSPHIDLNSINSFFGDSTAIGNTMTIKWTVTGLGPIANTLLNTIGGTVTAMTDTFTVLVNGVQVLSFSGSNDPFNFTGLAGVNIGANSTIEIDAVLKANAGSAQTSFDDKIVTVPDGGTTIVLLGAALSGLGCLSVRRKK